MWKTSQGTHNKNAIAVPSERCTADVNNQAEYRVQNFPENPQKKRDSCPLRKMHGREVSKCGPPSPLLQNRQEAGGIKVWSPPPYSAEKKRKIICIFFFHQVVTPRPWAQRVSPGSPRAAFSSILEWICAHFEPPGMLFWRFWDRFVHHTLSEISQSALWKTSQEPQKKTNGKAVILYIPYILYIIYIIYIYPIYPYNHSHSLPKRGGGCWPKALDIQREIKTTTIYIYIYMKRDS